MEKEKIEEGNGQCSQCGSSVPDGQSICSMCMGDINHGSDGHYQRWAEQEEINKSRADSEREDYERQCEQDAWEAQQQAMYEAEQQAAGQAAYEQGGEGQ